MTIAVDFDGTCVTHEYPEIGLEIGATNVLKNLVENGHKLILYTMRSDNTLEDAVNWFKEREIPLYGINNNPSQKRWTKSPKIFANLYIDDASAGAPLLRISSKIVNRPFINWVEIAKILEDNGCLLPEESEKLIEKIKEVQSNLNVL